MRLYIRYIGDINVDLDACLIETLNQQGFELVEVEYDEDAICRDLAFNNNDNSEDFDDFQRLKNSGSITIH